MPTTAVQDCRQRAWGSQRCRHRRSAPSPRYERPPQRRDARCAPWIASSCTARGGELGRVAAKRDEHRSRESRRLRCAVAAAERLATSVDLVEPAAGRKECQACCCAEWTRCAARIPSSYGKDTRLTRRELQLPGRVPRRGDDRDTLDLRLYDRVRERFALIGRRRDRRRQREVDRRDLCARDSLRTFADPVDVIVELIGRCLSGARHIRRPHRDDLQLWPCAEHAMARASGDRGVDGAVPSGSTSAPLPPSSAVAETSPGAVSGVALTPVSTRQRAFAPPGGGGA